MQRKISKLFDIADNRIARLGYSVWDHYICPEVVDIDILANSFRFSYDLHTTLFGPPEDEILERFHPRGEISLSYDPAWDSLVQKYFTEFKLMDKSAQGKEKNIFLCMEVNQQNFKKKENPISQPIRRTDSNKLIFKRRILYNQGLGGAGIFMDDKIIGGAFTPHYINDERFSFAIIRGVWIDKEYRNRGFGLDVSSKMCEMIFEKGIKRVTLWVEEDNIPAIKIYEKLGFNIVDKVFGVDCVRRT